MPDLLSIPLAVPIVTASAFAAAAVATPAVRAVARRFGAVALPRADRWHRSPTAMMGGIAIFIAVMATVPALVQQSRERWVVLGASTLLFAIGLIDDFLKIKPYQKLIGQLVGAAIVMYFGLVLPWTQSAALNMLITLIWLIGITNAVNMLDNMDGLSAGIAAIAALFLGMNFAANGQFNEALMLAGFGGALLGFLIYNHNPASIFMGDCGSMFIGFFLSSCALLSGTGGGRSRSLLAVLAVPVLVLCVPIFDTTFVTLMRKLSGRSASQGGRDHTSHRLVALGVSEKHAVWMLYALAVSAGLLALLARRASLDVSLAAIATFTIILTFLGIHLGRVRVYSEDEIAAARSKPIVAFLINLTHKRRVFEVLLDVVLISGAYYLAYAIKFGPLNASNEWQLFFRTLPIVVLVKVVGFLAAGVYRGIWRYASLNTVIVFGRAVAISSIATVLTIVFAFRFEGFSRTIFILDALILLMVVTASRFAFRLLRGVIRNNAVSGRNVVIYGAGDGGELVYRELRNNPSLRYVPVAFVDDDPTKSGRLIHGVRVYSATTSLSELCQRLHAEEVLISTEKITGERLTAIVGECAAAGLPARRACMSFEALRPADFGWVIPDRADVPVGMPLVSRLSDAALLRDFTHSHADN
ncbi:MAG: UDP-GlcNAc:undecaprenyl-phosphate/decaprenyl-phosphate GlcNAc-phosphate transferase [Thermoanaerobaculia bacterium]|jgi:UDP-GlcNAc:undecaprenyl-phosphate GlcNAc-1-phosphate transferase|nr:UDP-GlcNAc:undecaprenyl-phosphate/decaprenyl-phosphate GlcNAc-phosphate transferase [Thermoanaerobaculia bacterium]